MKNALMIGYSAAGGCSARRLEVLKEKLQLEHIYVICGPKDLAEYRSVADLTMNVWDMIYARYDEYPIDEKPLDDPRLDEIAPYAMEILIMMQRMRHYEKYEDAKNFYLRHLRYWSSFLEEKQIDVMIETVAPHEVFDYTIYRLCRARGIRTCIAAVMVEYQEDQGNAKFYHEDLEFREQRLSVLSESIKKEYAEETEIPLSRDFEKRYQLLSDYSDHYLEQGNRMPVAGGRATMVRRFHSAAGQPLKTMVSGMIGRIRTDRLLAMYNKHAVYPVEGEKYIYVPLHLTPECAACPQGGGLYADQTIVIDILCAAVPDGVKVYVKENPYQTCFGRDHGFYERILKNSNARLIREDTNQMALIRGSIAVSGLTGTAGYEGQYAGIPFLMFGYFVSRFAPGTICVRSVEECRTAIERILRGETSHWDRNDIRKYLRFLDIASIREKTCTDEEFATYMHDVLTWGKCG